MQKTKIYLTSVLFGLLLLLVGVALSLPAGATTTADAASPTMNWSCSLVGSDLTQSGECSYGDRSSVVEPPDTFIYEMYLPYSTLSDPATWGLDPNLYVLGGFEYFHITESGKYTGTKGEWLPAEFHPVYGFFYYKGVTHQYYQAVCNLRVTFVLDETKCPTVTLRENAPTGITERITVKYDGKEYDESTITLLPGETLKSLTCSHTPYGERVAAARFNGWLLEDGTPFDLSQPITENITLVASWTRRFEIWLDQRGLGGSFYYWATYDEGDTVTLPEPFPVAGSDKHYNYYFTLDGGTKPVTNFVCRSGHVVFEHQGDPLMYTVTYIIAGGDPIAPITVPYKTVLDLPKESTKEGYHIVGWCYDEAFTRLYDNAPIEADMQLYAKMAINTYTVTYDTAGGALLENVSVDWNTVAPQPTPTRPGYTFMGWFLADGTKYTNQSIKENTTLTAKWKIKTYFVTFMVDGKEYSKVTVTHGSPFVTIENQASKQGLNITALQTSSGASITDISAYEVTENLVAQASPMTGGDKVKNTVKRNWVAIALLAGGAIVLICVVCSLCTRKKKSYRR